MRVFFLAVLIMWPSLAGAHPCQYGESIEGRLMANGTSDGFLLAGRQETFVLAGVVVGDVHRFESGVVMRLYRAADHLDRYGRLPVFAFENQAFVQGALLGSGKAVADPTDLPAACLDALLTAETDKGLFDATDPAALAGQAGRFVRIRGQVLSVGDRKQMLYLNFGTNWGQDVTVSVAKTGRNRYHGDIAALAKLTGRDVTVRGLVEMRGGPLLRLTHEARLQRHD